MSGQVCLCKETHLELEHRGQVCESVVMRVGGGECNRKRKLFRVPNWESGAVCSGTYGDGSCQGRSEVSQVGETLVGVDSRLWWCTSLTFGSLGAMYDKAALNTSKLKKKSPTFVEGSYVGRMMLSWVQGKLKAALKIESRED